MLITEKCFIPSSSTDLFSYLFLKQSHGNGRKRFGSTAMAKKKDFQENINAKQQPNFPLRISNTVLAQSAVAVLGLGFVDAGYSGDWSRIGVISKETEDLLKVAAFLMVPLCLFIIFSFSKKAEN